MKKLLSSLSQNIKSLTRKTLQRKYLILALIVLGAVLYINSNTKDNKITDYFNVKLNESKEDVEYKLEQPFKKDRKSNYEDIYLYSGLQNFNLLVSFKKNKVSSITCLSGLSKDALCSLDVIKTGRFLKYQLKGNTENIPESFDIYTNLSESKIEEEIGKPKFSKIVQSSFKYVYYPDLNLFLGYKSTKLFLISVTKDLINFDDFHVYKLYLDFDNASKQLADSTDKELKISNQLNKIAIGDLFDDVEHNFGKLIFLGNSSNGISKFKVEGFDSSFNFDKQLCKLYQKKTIESEPLFEHYTKQYKEKNCDELLDSKTMAPKDTEITFDLSKKVISIHYFCDPLGLTPDFYSVGSYFGELGCSSSDDDINQKMKVIYIYCSKNDSSRILRAIGFKNHPSDKNNIYDFYSYANRIKSIRFSKSSDLPSNYSDCN